MRSALYLFLTLPYLSAGATHTFDVVVYGGTAGGVIAAVSAAREGLNTALLEPGSHLGGMVSGGLGWTDYGKKEVIGGYALEFYLRVGRYYQLPRYGQEIGWIHEPHGAEEIFRQMVREAGVQLFERTRMREKNSLRKTETKVAEIYVENGDAFAAKVFIDSTYEGDLMARAFVSYTFGREGRDQYGETLAGVRDRTPFHQFLLDLSPYREPGELLPEISVRRLPAPGTADQAVQAYNFRMCFSEVPENRVPFARPAEYDAHRYSLFAILLQARMKTEGRVPALNSVIKVDRIPNGKADINNQGAFSTDYIGGSWGYPDASYLRRVQIWQEHKDYQQGFFYFLANDPQVPAGLRQEMNRWGLCKDEFTDTGHWPHQLYIREARRMTGEYVMVQKDLQTDLTKPDPIGMGSYNSDSHNVERLVGPDGFVRNEGDMQVAVKPYQIPYRIMLPKAAEATNLLVPVAFSASHVAYSSVRMEPQYMILGQAAGVAASLAIAGETTVQGIAVATLVEKLKTQGAILEYVPSAQQRAIQLFQQRK
ncbi:putative secreted protein, xanthan lyase related [Candidatus Sulfopaludibacter sp. SbA3]|nr:putative secreted protein, xanthan lyase related [Candidatus Sulfopaludibacter sp. SbA3]